MLLQTILMQSRRQDEKVSHPGFTFYDLLAFEQFSLLKKNKKHSNKGPRNQEVRPIASIKGLTPYCNKFMVCYVISIFVRSLLFPFLSPNELLSADNRLFTQNKTMKHTCVRVCVPILLYGCQHNLCEWATRNYAPSEKSPQSKYKHKPIPTRDGKIHDQSTNRTQSIQETEKSTGKVETK